MTGPIWSRRQRCYANRALYRAPYTCISGQQRVPRPEAQDSHHQPINRRRSLSIRDGSALGFRTVRSSIEAKLCRQTHSGQAMSNCVVAFVVAVALVLEGAIAATAVLNLTRTTALERTPVGPSNNAGTRIRIICERHDQDREEAIACTKYNWLLTTPSDRNHGYSH